VISVSTFLRIGALYLAAAAAGGLGVLLCGIVSAYPHRLASFLVYSLAAVGAVYLANSVKRWRPSQRVIVAVANIVAVLNWPRKRTDSKAGRAESSSRH
jgi:hypothetical protein